MTLKLFLATIILSISCFVAPIALTGCGTSAAKTTQVAGTVTVSVDGAMSAWGDYVRAGRATVDQRVQVRAAYQKYQASMLVAEKVALSVLAAPENQSAYVTALNAAAQASVEVITLVELFLKK